MNKCVHCGGVTLTRAHYSLQSVKGGEHFCCSDCYHSVHCNSSLSLDKNYSLTNEFSDRIPSSKDVSKLR